MFLIELKRFTFELTVPLVSYLDFVMVKSLVKSDKYGMFMFYVFTFILQFRQDFFYRTRRRNPLHSFTFHLTSTEPLVPPTATA